MKYCSIIGSQYFQYSSDIFFYSLPIFLIYEILFHYSKFWFYQCLQYCSDIFCHLTADISNLWTIALCIIENFHFAIVSSIIQIYFAISLPLSNIWNFALLSSVSILSILSRSISQYHCQYFQRKKNYISVIVWFHSKIIQL